MNPKNKLAEKPEEACRAATTGLFLMLGTSLMFNGPLHVWA